MDQTLLLNRLAISRWGVEYLNAAQSGMTGGFPGETKEPRSLSQTERALYEACLEMLNRFVQGEFEFDEPKTPQPPRFEEIPPAFMRQLMRPGPPPAGTPAEEQGP